MRVVHTVTRFLKAGAEENILLSCNGQVKLGHEVHLIHGRDHSPDMLKLLDPAVKVHCTPSLIRSISPYHDIRAYRETVKLLREIRPDIVHTHTSKAGIIGRLAARRCGVPCIIHGVHMLAFTQVSSLQRLVYLFMEQIAAPCTHAFINVSKGTLEECVAHGIGERKHHYIVPSGMDVSRFRTAAPADWRTLIPADQVSPANPKFIILVGALEPRKQQIPFLTMFREVAAQVPDAAVLLVGEGEQEDAVRKHITACGLQGRVVMLGFRKDIDRLLTISSVGVLPSLREGLARVVIQYTLAGLPIVCTHTPGVEAIVTAGTNGYLVPIGELDKMVQPLVNLLTDSALHQRMANAARTTDLSAWDTDHMVQEIENIYRKYAKPQPQKVAV